MKKYIVLATLTCMGWVMLAQPPQFAMRPFSQGLSWAYPTTDSVYGQPQFVQYLRFGPKEYSFDLAWVTDTYVLVTWLDRQMQRQLLTEVFLT